MPTPIITATQALTAIQEPTPTPLLAYAQPIVLIEFGGTAVTVTEDYQLPASYKAVLYWQVA